MHHALLASVHKRVQVIKCTESYRENAGVTKDSCVFSTHFDYKQGSMDMGVNATPASWPAACLHVQVLERQTSHPSIRASKCTFLHTAVLFISHPWTRHHVTFTVAADENLDSQMLSRGQEILCSCTNTKGSANIAADYDHCSPKLRRQWVGLFLLSLASLLRA